MGNLILTNVGEYEKFTLYFNSIEVKTKSDLDRLFHRRMKNGWSIYLSERAGEFLSHTERDKLECEITFDDGTSCFGHCLIKQVNVGNDRGYVHLLGTGPLN